MFWKLYIASSEIGQKLHFVIVIISLHIWEAIYSYVQDLSQGQTVCRLYLNFWNLWLNLFTSWRTMSAWKVNKIQLLLLGLWTKTLNNDILCTVDCSMVNLFWFRLCVAGLPTDPLAGWRHRLRDGNSLDFKNPRGVPRQNHVYLLRSTLAQGGLVL